MTPLEVVIRIAAALERIADAVAAGGEGARQPPLHEALRIIVATRFDDHGNYHNGCRCLACHARRTLEGL